MYCRNCGSEISNNADSCPKCGEPFRNNQIPGKISPKSKVTALLLCFFLGAFGAHRFYVGKIGTGIIQFLTLGGLGIWAIIDFIYLICNKFTDKDGALVAGN